MASDPTTPPLQYSWRFLSSHIRLAVPRQTIDGIESDSISIPKKIKNNTLMAYFCLNQAEHAYVVKTWTEGLLSLFITLGLPDTQILRSGPADVEHPLTDSRLLLAFPGQQDTMIVEMELGKGVQVVPGGPAWRSEPIPREVVNTDILHLNLKRALGRAFFIQIAIPRLFQLLAPRLGTPPDPVLFAVWKKLMYVPPQRSEDVLAGNHHKFMVYQLAKAALGRVRGRAKFSKKMVRSRQGMSKRTQFDRVIKLECNSDNMQNLQDEQQIAADQQSLIAPFGVVQNPLQQSSDEEFQLTYRPPMYWWAESSRFGKFGPERLSLDLKSATPKTICYDDDTPENAAALFLNSPPGL